MGKQLSFSEENVKKNPFDYPKLKLAKGESARLTYVEDPYTEWVHNIQKPQLDERGNVLYKTMERKDGTEYQTPKLSFVSNPICLGSDDVLEADGIDPENCPVCARAAAGGKGFFPKRRFAMHVIRTNTQPRSNTPVEPYSGQLLIWAFTDNVFSNIFALGKEFGLKDHDLILGPCEDATFQKAKLSIANGTAVDEKTRAAIFDEKNRSEDPTVFCGNRKTKARIEDDLAVVDAEWAKSNGEEAALPSKSLNDGISALLDEEKPKPDVDSAGWANSTEPVTSFDDIPETAPKKSAPVDSSSSINDILDSL